MSVLTTTPLLLAGRPADGHAAPLAVRSPWRGAEVAVVAAASTQDVASAVDAAAEAAPVYAGEPAYRRAALLARAAELLDARAPQIAAGIVDECGKTIREAQTECARAVTTLRIGAEEAKRVDGELLALDAVPAGAGRIGHVRRVALGPVAAITPFNSPLNLVAHKVAPALAAGNPIVVKPAEVAPLGALALGEAVAEAAGELGVPAGVISVLPARGEDADPLVTDERVRLLTFTGSARVGWGLHARAVRKRVMLELGANGAAIVEPDANLAWAAARCAQSAFAHAGQVCASLQRVFVHRDVADDFLARLVAAARELQVGDPQDPATEMGPVVSPAAADRIVEWVGEAADGGAEVRTGGKADGTLVAPTVLTGTLPDMRVVAEEVFGPVVCVEPYDALDEAIAAANATPFGLQAGLFTHDVRTVHRVHAELEVGSVIVNDATVWRVDQMPFGGAKASGLGREGLRYAIREHTQERLLVLNLDEPEAAA